MNKIILFGAGKIGRSFIGQLFSRGGYEVIFVDTDKNLIGEINKLRSYHVIIKSDLENEIITIDNIRGIALEDRRQIAEEISDTSIMATCVGPSNLAAIVPVISEGIRIKNKNGIDCRTDLIIAENLRNAADYLRELFIDELGDKKFIDKNIGLIETSIGKMVPIMTKKDIEEDMLQVFAEPYNTLILDKTAFRNPIPDIPGLAPKDNMKAWVDRKSFIHNLGHAAAAYFGYIKHPRRAYLHEVLADKEVIKFTKHVMLQSAEAVMKEYPGEFTPRELTDHIDDLIFRFQNKALGDTVFRVGMDLYRKLGPEDRLVGAMRMASHHQQPFDMIAYAFVCGFYFRAKDESGNDYPADLDFASKFRNTNLSVMVNDYCGISPDADRELLNSVTNAHGQLRSTYHLKP